MNNTEKQKEKKEEEKMLPAETNKIQDVQILLSIIATKATNHSIFFWVSPEVLDPTSLANFRVR